MSNPHTFSVLLLAVQVAYIAFFVSSSTYDEESFAYSEYIIFRDIMAMLLLGFGYLMTFLASYGLGAVGFTMILTALSMQTNIMIEYAFKAAFHNEERVWPLNVEMMTIIDAEFAAATLLITFGAVIGRASPLQMFVITMSQSVFYAFNKVIMVFGLIEAEDVGGTITIHMFGAYFGLAASYALGPPDDGGEPDEDKISDIFAFIGTGILWVFWPSFVGATETGHDIYEMRCVSNTIFSLLASTAATFYLSHKLSGYKFDPVHIANATLAGGVAIGSSARLVTAPGGAVVVGTIAGAASVWGYFSSSPMLESRLSLHDTCGVGNLHGLPSLVGAMASAVFVHMNSDAEFLSHDSGTQIGRQFAAMFCTLAISIVSGFLTGKLAVLFQDDEALPFKDKCWWTASYFDFSHHSCHFNNSRHSATAGSCHGMKIADMTNDTTQKSQQTNASASKDDTEKGEEVDI